MNETLIILNALLNGESVYHGSDTKQAAMDVLARLVEAGEVVEHRTGSRRWWKIEQGALAFVRERRKVA